MPNEHQNTTRLLQIAAKFIVQAYQSIIIAIDIPRIRQVALRIEVLSY
jgi:hypothetical protein